jgi:hypothetical protein
MMLVQVGKAVPLLDEIQVQPFDLRPNFAGLVLEHEKGVEVPCHSVFFDTENRFDLRN